MKIVFFFFFAVFIPLFLYEGHGCGRVKRKNNRKSSIGPDISSDIPKPPSQRQTKGRKWPWQRPPWSTSHQVVEQKVESESSHNNDGDSSRDSNPPSEMDDMPQKQLSEKQNNDLEQPHQTDVNVPEINIIRPETDENDEEELNLYGDKYGVGGGTIQEFNEGETPEYIIEAHAEEREGLNELTWSDDLAEFARKNAAKCHKSTRHYLHENVADVPGFSMIGENRYFDTDFIMVGNAIVAWSDSENEDVYGLAMKQLLSTTITHVGCGKANCPDPNPKPKPKVSRFRDDDLLQILTPAVMLRQGKGKKQPWEEDRVYCEYGKKNGNIAGSRGFTNLKP